MDSKASPWTWEKDIVVAANGTKLAYHVPMQFPAYSSIGKMLSSMCTCFHVSTYKVCYEPLIAPINGQNMWRLSGVQPIQPSIKRRPPGRPKKKKAMEVGEPAGRRAGISKQCRACGKIEHNKTSCKAEIGGNSSLPGITKKIVQPIR